MVRSTSSPPTRLSRAVIAWDRLGWLTPRVVAASPKCWWSHNDTKALSWEKEGRGEVGMSAS